MMEKIKIKKNIVFKSLVNRPTWNDLKTIQQTTPFEDDDVIFMAPDDIDECFIISVERLVEETDEELALRVKRTQDSIEVLRKRRYENYLKLKAEFENEASDETTPNT